MNKFIMFNVEGFNNDMVFYNEMENSIEKQDSENVSIISKQPKQKIYSDDLGTFNNHINLNCHNSIIAY